MKPANEKLVSTSEGCYKNYRQAKNNYRPKPGKIIPRAKRYPNGQSFFDLSCFISLCNIAVLQNFVTVGYFVSPPACRGKKSTPLAFGDLRCCLAVIIFDSFCARAILTHWIFRSFLHIVQKAATRCFACGVTTARATNTPTQYKEINFTTTISTRPPNVIRNLEQGKMVTPNIGPLLRFECRYPLHDQRLRF